MSERERAGADGAAKAGGAGSVTRRRFLRGAGELAAGGVLANGLLGGCAAVEGAAAVGAGPSDVLEGEVEVELAINGQRRKVTVEPRTTLLDALRTRLEPPLPGTKLVCDRGNCGACTVTVDGEPAYACLLLACRLGGRAIGTVEGLGTPEAPAPLQRAFHEHDASMCGFCTPGFVVAISAHLARSPGASEAEIREACAGNLCRCGTYPEVFAAALATARRAAAAGGR